MEEKKFYKSESRKEWYSTGELSTDKLSLGCLMRIADSLERMEEPYLRILERIRGMEHSSRERMEKIRDLKRSNAALRGHLTRARKQK